MRIEEPDRRPCIVRPTNVRTLAALVPGANVFGQGEAVVAGIAYDSRAVRPGHLFCALVGGYYDGHDFARHAIQQGATAILVERCLPVDVPQIIVRDTRAALAPMSAEIYGHPSRQMRIVGVTGTDGKTTTTYMIEAMFGQAGVVTGVMGTIAIRVGETVLETDTRQTTPESADVQRLLCEMANAGTGVALLEATSHGLDLHRLDHVRFSTAAVTNITHEHLEHHKTVAAYWRAKARLFEMVDESGGTAVVNLDDEGARSMLPYVRRARVVTYGLDRSDVDVSATEIYLDADRSSYTLTAQGERIDVETAMVGRFNVANAACAVSVAIAHDISLETCRKALNRFEGVPGRMRSIRRSQPFTVIVDYAHTPESIEKVLELLRSLNPAGRLILVMGSAGERDATKRPLQGAVAARMADLSVFTTEDPRFEDPEEIIDQIASGARAAGAREGHDFFRVTDRREAIEFAISNARAGDTVLLAGKGHERSIIWRHEKRPWDEAAVAEDILETLGFQGEET